MLCGSGGALRCALRCAAVRCAALRCAAARWCAAVRCGALRLRCCGLLWRPSVLRGMLYLPSSSFLCSWWLLASDCSSCYSPRLALDCSGSPAILFKSLNTRMHATRLWLAGHVYSRDQPHGKILCSEANPNMSNAATCLWTHWLAIGSPPSTYVALVNRGFSSRKACRLRLAPGPSNCRRATATTHSANLLAGAGGPALSTYNN